MPNRFVPFTLKDFQGIMEEGNHENLDNFDITNCAQTDVQMTREMKTENGCYVTLVFPRKSRPGVRRRISGAFLSSIEKGIPYISD